MSARRAALAAALVATSMLLATSVAGCRLLPVARRPGIRITAPSGPPAALAVIVDAGSARARADALRMIEATARPGEHLIVLDAADGALLGAFTAPRTRAIAGPARPAPLGPDPTSFQRAAYRKSLRHVRLVVRGDGKLLLARQRRELRDWADRSVAAALAEARRHGRHGGHAGPSGLALAITRAVADVAGLAQTGISFGLRRVIAIVGSVGETARPPRTRASLGGVTVAVADGPGYLDGAAWQTDLVEAGANRVFVLAAATRDRLSEIVAAGLAGTAGIAFLTRIRYGTDQYRLPAAAIPALERLRGLLAVTYPRATAAINGYTDDVAVRGGNLALSWRRAKAVLAWLTAHGIAAARLQAIGHGSADPVAPNRPGGQPLNRRVVIIITPAT